MKSVSQVVEKPYSKEEIAGIKQLFEELKKFRGHLGVENYTKKLESKLKA